jgi:hypothetical protein
MVAAGCTFVDTPRFVGFFKEMFACANCSPSTKWRRGCMSAIGRSARRVKDGRLRPSRLTKALLFRAEDLDKALAESMGPEKQSKNAPALA